MYPSRNTESWLSSGQEHGQHRAKADGTCMIAKQAAGCRQQTCADPGGAGGRSEKECLEDGTEDKVSQAKTWSYRGFTGQCMPWCPSQELTLLEERPVAEDTGREEGSSGYGGGKGRDR